MASLFTEQDLIRLGDPHHTTHENRSIICLGGDLRGAITNGTVAALQGLPIAATAPTPGQVLTWNGSSWVPAAVPNPATPRIQVVAAGIIKGDNTVEGIVLGGLRVSALVTGQITAMPATTAAAAATLAAWPTPQTTPCVASIPDWRHRDSTPATPRLGTCHALPIPARRPPPPDIPSPIP